MNSSSSNCRSSGNVFVVDIASDRRDGADLGYTLGLAVRAVVRERVREKERNYGALR